MAKRATQPPRPYRLEIVPVGTAAEQEEAYQSAIRWLAGRVLPRTPTEHRS